MPYRWHIAAAIACLLICAGTILYSVVPWPAVGRMLDGPGNAQVIIKIPPPVAPPLMSAPILRKDRNG